MTSHGNGRPRPGPALEAVAVGSGGGHAMTETALRLRRADTTDLSEMLPLLRAALGWGDDDRYARLFAWKHRENPFGASPIWVAEDDGRIVALRVLMRWEFTFGRRAVRAVRAVDTATDPEYQGQGLFKRLTLQGVEELTADGVDWVFNTPNDQSRPGYLKMGWQEVGHLPIGARPRSLPSLARMVRARTPAERWSEVSAAGESAPDVLADHAAVAQLLADLPVDGGVRTRLSPEFLAWRYGLADLAYRAVVHPRGLRDGLAIFRVRRRGAAREIALTQVLAPGGARAAKELVRRLAREADGDYVIGLGPDRGPGFLPMPGQGPLLTWRALADDVMPPLDAWHLGLGDVELF